MHKPKRKPAEWFLHFSVLALAMTMLNLSAQDFEYSTIAGLPGVFGGFTDGTNSDARFDSPASVAVDSGGNLYVADYFNNIIRKLTPVGTNWVVKTIAGLAGTNGFADGTNSNARFNHPSGVAADAQGNLFVADYFNHIIRKITPTGANWVVKTIAGSGGTNGITDGTNSNARFYFPRSVAVDAGGNVFVADLDNSTIRKVTPVGTNWVVTTLAGLARNYGSSDGTNANARFYWPAGIAVDTNENVFVSDNNNNTIRKLKASGTNWVVTTLAGFATTNGSSDGTNGDARFFSPASVAVDAGGNVYVADSGNDSLRKLTPAGTNWIVTTIGGQAGNPGSDNGVNMSALFNQPVGIAADSLGNIYVADSENNTIRKGRSFASAIPLPPVFQTITQSNGLVVLTWSVVLGQSYQAQYQTNLVQPNWINLGGLRVATNLTMTASDFIGPDPQRFYRIILLLP